MRPSPCGAERRAVECGRQAAQLRNDVHARSQARAEKRGERETEAARGARARTVALVAPERRGGDVGEARERRIEVGDVGGRRAFLCAERRGSAGRPAQWIIDVGCDLDRHVREPHVERREIDRGEVPQRRAARREFASRGVEKPRAQGREHARAAVVRRAAADADDDPPRARVECRRDRFARTVRRCGARVVVAPLEQRETRRARHLDDGEIPVAGECRFDGRATWPAHDAAFQVRTRVEERIDRTLAAVGHRNARDVVAVAEHGTETALQGSSRFERARAAFEFIGSDDEARASQSGAVGGFRPVSHRAIRHHFESAHHRRMIPCGAAVRAADVEQLLTRRRIR